MRRLIGLLLLVLAAFGGLYGAAGFVFAAPAAVMVTAASVAACLLIGGILLYAPHVLLPQPTPTKIIAIDPSGPSPHIPRPRTKPMQMGRGDTPADARAKGLLI